VKGSEQAGTRPVIIVSREAINRNSSVVICVPCTNVVHSGKIYPSQLLLKKGMGGLRADSVVMCEQIRAVTTARLVTHLGKLDSQTMKALDDRLRIALDLE
jgi:mRNA interferase MazF